jgi:flagellar motor switch protein FliN/FliY
MEEELKQGQSQQENVTQVNNESENSLKSNSASSKISEIELPEFEESKFNGSDSLEKLSFLKDLQLSIYIELGRTQMQIKDILELERGYVIELDKLASEPVDIYVNNKKIAEGEVVVIDKHFGIRIVNLVDVSNRLKGIS